MSNEQTTVAGDTTSTEPQAQGDAQPSPGSAANFPPPPHARISAAKQSSEGDKAVLRLLDGSRKHGVLIEFDPRADVVRFHEQGSESIDDIPLATIKVLHASEATAWQAAAEIQTGNSEVDIAPEPRDFEVVFKDNDRLQGSTLGFRTDGAGLYLYPEREGRRVVRSFVPHSAIEHYQVGPQIGDTLVAAGAVSRKTVDAALETQQHDREARLGDILGKQAVVTTGEIENALSRQGEIPHMRLGEILVGEGVISAEQLSETLALQQSGKRRPLGELLISLGVIDEKQVQQALAAKLGIPVVDLHGFYVDRQAFDLVPTEVITRYGVLPLYQSENRVVVAMSDPLNAEALDAVGFATNMRVDPVLANSAEIARVVHLMTTMKMPEDDEVEAELALNEEPTAAFDDSSIQDTLSHSDNLVVRMVNKILLGALYVEASDIHIESQPDSTHSRVRVRVDGALQEQHQFSGRMHRAVIARLKIMADLDTTERRRPQDGRIDLKRFTSKDVALRVASIPTRGGPEDMVLRVLGGAIPLTIDRLALSYDNQTRLLRSAGRSNGLLLVTGPTGSGKSTTLHAILSHINTPERKVWTVEDPIEITQSGLRQVQVHVDVGLTFARALRAFLRLDPDVIMVGEMRDEETANISLEAALTGHLVLSTLHTNGAPDTVVRLLEMGMDPFNFADALAGILTQRLARRLCKHCAEDYALMGTELDDLAIEYAAEAGEAAMAGNDWLARMRVYVPGLSDPPFIRRARGCEECRNTGYSGRVALHEMLLPSMRLKEMIHRHCPLGELRTQCIADGMRTLKQDAIEKVLAGLTDVSEMRAACGSSEG